MLIVKNNGKYIDSISSDDIFIGKLELTLKFLKNMLFYKKNILKSPDDSSTLNSNADLDLDSERKSFFSRL